jgi:NAD(P)-dependent dehydrogenase (short-subunit alcohol dehydrogenase family)
LLREGAAVTIVDLNQPAGIEVVREISIGGGRAIFERADVTRASDCRCVIERTVQEFGGIHVLFNNAGIIRRASVIEISEDDWDAVMAVNVKSIFLMSREVIPIMAKGGRRFDCQHGFGMGAGGWRAGGSLLRFERRCSAAHQSHGD